MASPPEEFADLTFPIKGLDVSVPFDEQPYQTTPVGKNVRAFEPSSNRARGGARPGFVQYVPARVSGPNLIQELNYVVHTDVSALGSGGGFYPPGGNPVISIVPPFSWPLQTVTITGSGFISPLTVTIGGLPATPTIVSPTTITVAVPSEPVGPEPIKITNPTGPSNVVTTIVVDIYAMQSFSINCVANALDYFGNVLFTPSSLLGYEAPNVCMDQIGNGYYAAALPPGGIAFVQSGTGTSTTPNNTVTLSVTKNNLLVVCIQGEGSPNLATVSDNQGNTYHFAGSKSSVAFFWSLVGTTVSTTIQATGAGGAEVELMVVAEYSGSHQTAPFGSFLSKTGNSLTPSTGVIGIAEVGDLIVACETTPFGINGPPTVAVALDFILRQSFSGDDNCLAYADYPNAQSSESANFTLTSMSPTLSWIAAGCLFKIPPAGISVFSLNTAAALQWSQLFIIPDGKHVYGMCSQVNVLGAGDVWILYKSAGNVIYVSDLDAQTGAVKVGHLCSSAVDLPTGINTDQGIAQSALRFAVSGSYNSSGLISVYKVLGGALVSKSTWPPSTIQNGTGTGTCGAICGDGQGNFYFAASIAYASLVNDGVAMCDSKGNLTWLYFAGRGVASPSGLPTGVSYDPTLKRVFAVGTNSCLSGQVMVTIDADPSSATYQQLTNQVSPGAVGTKYSVSSAGDGTVFFCQGGFSYQLNEALMIQWTQTTGLAGKFVPIAAFNWQL